MLAELRIASGVAAVVIATVPIWLAVFDAILTRRRPSNLVIGGLAAGLVGVAVLLVPVEGIEDLDPLGIGLVLALGGAAAGGVAIGGGAAGVYAMGGGAVGTHVLSATQCDAEALDFFSRTFEWWQQLDVVAQNCVS